MKVNPCSNCCTATQLFKWINFYLLILVSHIYFTYGLHALALRADDENNVSVTTRLAVKDLYLWKYPTKNLKLIYKWYFTVIDYYKRRASYHIYTCNKRYKQYTNELASADVANAPIFAKKSTNKIGNHTRGGVVKRKAQAFLRAPLSRSRHRAASLNTGGRR